MKKLAFILLIGICSCQPDIIQDNQNTKNLNEIINLKQSEEIPKGVFGFSVTDGTVNGNMLTLNIAHAGCDPNQGFKLFSRQVGHKVCVPDTLHLVYFSNPDMCERLNQREISVDISALSNCRKTLIIKGGDKGEFIINW